MSNSILVACPTHISKLYALRAYVDAYEAFTYPNKSLVFCDNTPNSLGYKHILAQFAPCLRSEPMKNLQDAIELAWVVILDYAHWYGYDYVMSIEQDVICPPNTIEVMLEHSTAKRPIVQHSYPCRGPGEDTGRPIYSIGCCLLPVNTLWRDRFQWVSVFEGWVRYYSGEVVNLTGLLDIAHMREDGETILERGEPVVPNPYE